MILKNCSLTSKHHKWKQILRKIFDLHYKTLLSLIYKQLFLKLGKIKNILKEKWTKNLGNSQKTIQMSNKYVHYH